MFPYGDFSSIFFSLKTKFKIAKWFENKIPKKVWDDDFKKKSLIRSIIWSVCSELAHPSFPLSDLPPEDYRKAKIKMYSSIANMHGARGQAKKDENENEKKARYEKGENGIVYKTTKLN